MATLHKKHSANLGTKTPNAGVESPGSKSDQGGGVRLNVGLDSLSLSDSPSATIHGTPQPHNGHGHSLLPQQRGNHEDDNGPFQLGKHADDGDVFDSPGKTHEAHPAGLAHKFVMAQSSGLAHPSAAAVTQVSASPSAVGSTMQGVIPSTQPVAMLRTRASDLSSRAQVGGIDAQSFYPATACVFVANLPDFVRDSRLEAELTRAFSKFGVVFVKIRRDQRNMPFAFCQYTKDEDARNAVVQGRGILIEGRPCRTEMVKANRSFVIYHVLGDEITIDEAHKQMCSFGSISKCELLHPQIQAAMQIKGGALVEYTNFDPGRDVIAAFRHSSSYRVAAYDLKKVQQAPKMDPDEAWLQRYEVDRRSIFVGNLPVQELNLEGELYQLAEEVGDVQKVQVVRKDGRTGRPMPIAFGFVEFSRVDMADLAVKRLAGRVLGGSMIRVERKASKEPQSIRRSYPDAVSPDADQSSSPGGEQKRLTAAKAAEPATPSHAAVNSLLLSAHSNGTMPSASRLHRVQSFGYMPYTGQNYGSPYGSPEQYHTGTPRAAGAGIFPATPQATPGMHNPSPLTYYGTPYAWATPYLQDPGYTSMAYYGMYSSPLAAAPGTLAEEDAQTPTNRGVGATENIGDGSAQHKEA